LRFSKSGRQSQTDNRTQGGSEKASPIQPLANVGLRWMSIRSCVSSVVGEFGNRSLQFLSTDPRRPHGILGHTVREISRDKRSVVTFLRGSSRSTRSNNSLRVRGIGPQPHPIFIGFFSAATSFSISGWQNWWNAMRCVRTPRRER
jgi:hypothetical protein